MAADASHALGAPEVAGAFVNPKGMTKKVTAAVAGQVAGGAVGTFAAKMKTGPAYQGVPDVPNFGRVGYVAVTADEVALVKTDTGMLKMKISDEVLARSPRTEVTSAELDKGVMLSHLKIDFTNGVSWEFDVPKKDKKSAQEVVRALGGTIR
ncbi:MAG: hypothetical protein WAQ33_17595 [Gaiellaceae bacterium]